MQDYAPSHTALSPEASSAPKRRAIGFTYIIPVGLLLGFVLFLISYVLRNEAGLLLSDSSTGDNSPTPTASLVAAEERLPSTTPTKASPPTPVASTDKKEVNILVLNGSGVSGVAGKMKQELTDVGYTTVRTGNAEAFSYTDITIQATTAHRIDAEGLKQTLAKTHTVGTIETVASAEADIVVIVGK